jgi:hypothetical protein
MRSILILTTLLAISGCDPHTKAFTLPLPLGGSIVIPLKDLDECEWAHEHVHQEQVLRMGSTRFLKAIAAEYLEFGDRCGPLELEAYAKQWDCRSPGLEPWKPEQMKGALGCE